MALAVIRDAPSRPLSDYDVTDFAHLPSGYRGLIVEPGYIPRDLSDAVINTSTPLLRYRPDYEKSRIVLSMPVMSAAMQAVSGYRMGIELSRQGGIATIPQSQEIDDQVEQVRNTKRYKGAFVEPEVVAPYTPIERIIERMKHTGYSKFFVTKDGEQHGTLLGVITDIDFDEKRHAGLLVQDRMRHFEQLEVAHQEDVGYDLESANERLMESRHSAMPIIYSDGRLRDVVFRKDVREHRIYENELIDNKKRLMVAAAVNTRDYKDRVPALLKAGADVFVIDTSQGHTDFVYDTTHFIRQAFGNVPIIGGNVVTKRGFRFLVEKCDVDAVKIGMGIGSICITPDQIGVAKGQDKAVEDVTAERDAFFADTGIYYPLIADGGIHSVRDMNIALAFGADVAMLGYFLAGVDETPTEVNYKKSPPSKPYWGEGSARARMFREQRGYNPAFDEGVERWAPYVGPLEPYLTTKMKQLKDGMRKAGCRSIDELHRLATITTISEQEAKPIGE